MFLILPPGDANYGTPRKSKHTETELVPLPLEFSAIFSFLIFEGKERISYVESKLNEFSSSREGDDDVTQTKSGVVVRGRGYTVNHSR